MALGPGTQWPPLTEIMTFKKLQLFIEFPPCSGLFERPLKVTRFYAHLRRHRLNTIINRSETVVREVRAYILCDG
jgi:hypothetical protein